MLDFMLSFGSTVSAITYLLKTKFLPGHPANENPLGLSLRRVLRLHEAGQVIERDFELARLRLFVGHLQRIERQRPDLLRTYRRKLKGIRNTDSFYGTRFEINIASSLLKKKLAFDKTERPDFTLANGVGIECTSARVRKARGREDLSYKLEATIDNKTSKGYGTRSTALFVDLTNLAHTSSNFRTEPFRETAISAASESAFGAILLFFHVYNKDKGYVELAYVRVDHPQAAPELIDFLNEHYPIGDHRVWSYSIPPEG